MATMSTVMGKIKVKYLFICCAVIFLLEFFGAFVHIREKDYFESFTYPLDGNVLQFAKDLRIRGKASVDPINRHDYVMLKTSKGKCLHKKDDGSTQFQPIRVVFLVKSAMEHFHRREIIRKTWGFEKRFSDVPIRTVFLLGSNPDDAEMKRNVDEENQKFGDIVQGDFVDSYYNNTLKAMLGLRWSAEMCKKARFYFFVDDDYYVSTRNLLRFLRNPVNYPTYLEQDVIDFDEVKRVKSKKLLGVNSNMRQLQQLIDFELPEDVKLYAGFVFHTPPHRHKSSRWYVSLDEYPYHLWPPYVTAGAYVLSHDALSEFYYGSYFVKRFRFDDVYMGLVAKKTEIEPFHSDEFHFYKKPYTVRNYRYVVASHGYSDMEEMEKVWTEQKQAGNA